MSVLGDAGDLILIAGSVIKHKIPPQLNFGSPLSGKKHRLRENYYFSSQLFVRNAFDMFPTFHRLRQSHSKPPSAPN